MIRSLLLILPLVVVLGGCRETKTSCDLDTECDPDGTLFLRCLVDEGICGCSDDRGCSGDNEVCNASGRCQTLAGCNSNDECVTDSADRCANQFCDVDTGQCVGICECGSGEDCCTQDSHCAFKEICNGFEGRCVPGCRGDGDCLLGEGCVGAGLAGQLGVCEVGLCTANNQCSAGEICNLADGVCTVDVRGPYCAGCSGGVGSEDCGEPANYCLTDPGGAGEFCGVDCSLDQACPFGYECTDIIVFFDQCGAEICNAGTCTTTGGNCVVDEDCPQGPPHGSCPRGDLGRCLLDGADCTVDTDCCGGGECPEGSCVLQECRGFEGGAIGVCSCITDVDCPNDSCEGADLSDPNNLRFGNCEISGHQCLADEDCNTIACIDGGCRIGSNCGPANDRTCPELIQSP